MFETTQDAKQDTLAESPSPDLKTRREYTKKGKSYLQKLKLFGGKALRYHSKFPDMKIRPPIFLTFPVTTYAGFS